MKQKIISVRLEMELYEELKRYAEEDHRTVSNMIQMVIYKLLEERSAK